MAYDTDPDVAAFLTGGKSSPVGKIPTKEPTMEQLREIQKKKKVSDANQQIQPEPDTDYTTDPDIAAFSTTAPTKPTSQTKIPSQLNQVVGKGIQAVEDARSTIKGAAEAGATVLSSMAALPVAALSGLVYGVRGGEAPEQAKRIMQDLTYMPKTEKGQQYLEDLQRAFEASKIPPVGLPELAGTQLLRQGAKAQIADAPAQIKAAFEGAKKALPEVRIERPNLQSAGAAAAVPENVLRGNIDSALTNASPELQTHIQSKPPQSVNIPALETKALEEKHGVNLSTGQRTDDTQLYSQEWNKRAETATLGGHFNEQPTQISNAFETAKQRHAPDIPSTADASELGQLQINALAAKDAIRQEGISNAYKALQDANGGQFPIDVSKLDAGINAELSRTLKTNHLSDSIRADLKDFYQNPTFEAYEALRTNLSNEMRSSSNGNARGAAYVVRQELEKLPVFGEEVGSPQAIQLKALADNARKLFAQRQAIIKSNPAYKAAIKEAGSLEEATAQGESLNAAKFHNKYVAGATPEAIRRMKAEIPEGDIANQAITFSELSRAKNAAVNASERNLTPEQFAKFYKQNKSALRESLPPEAMQDVTELGMLTSKIGQPKTGTFNYSNSFSSMLAEMAKEGLLSLGEAKLAGATGGASIPAVGLTKQWMQKLNKEGFAREAVNPYGGLTKE
jgi:hypothetical protein